jgi:RNA polymerase sigma-70 factor (ECF subfamily)
VKSEDELLITQALAGDSNSYSLLFAKYWKRVYLFLRKRVHDSYLAEELTQEVFVAAYKYLKTYNKELSSFYTWLCTIAVNKASKRPYKALNIEVEWYTSVTPETLLNGKQEFHELLDVISELPEKQRKALYMKHSQGMCYTDIGVQLAVSPSYAKKLVYQAKKQIRSVYAKR